VNPIRRFAWLLATVAVMLAVALAGRSAAAAEVELSTQVERLEVRPGQVTSFSVAIHNAGAARAVVEQLTMPEGWRLLTPAPQVGLQAQGMTIRIVSLAVPASAPAGPMEVGYTLRGADDLTVLGVLPIVGEVAAEASLVLDWGSTTDFVVAGREAEAELLVSNSGNTTLSVALSAVNDPALRQSFTPSKLELEAGQTGRAVLTMVASRAADAPGPHTVRVVARGRGLQVAVAEAKTYFLMDLVPEARPGGQLHTVPSRARVSGMGDGSAFTGQVDVSGAGPLDQQDRVAIDYRLRGPDANALVPFTEREELRATVTSKHLDVMAGDDNYRLSRLLAPYEYGRGGGFEVRPGPVVAGGHALVSRFELPTSDQQGGYLGAKVGTVADVRLNGVRRGRAEEAATTAGSVSADLQPIEELDVYAEGAYGGGEEGGGEGYLGEAIGRIGDDIHVAVMHLKAAPELDVYYHDLRQTMAFASFESPLWSWVNARLSGNSSWSSRNLDDRVSEGAAPDDNRQRASGDLRFDRGWFATVEGNWAGHADRLIDDRWREHALRVRAGRQAGLLGAYVDSLFGAQSDTEGERNAGRSLGLVSYARLASGAGLGLFGTWSQAPADVSAFFVHGWSFGANGSANIADRGRLDGTYQHRVSSLVTRQADYRASVELGGPHIMGGQARHRWVKGEPADHAGLLFYELSFGIPVARIREAGTVAGRIVDGEGADGAGIDGVVVLVDGRVAVTDKQGAFLVHGVRPGPRLIKVDHGTLGLERVFADPSALQLEVVGGTRTEVELATVRSGQVTGWVRLASDAAGSGGLHAAGADVVLLGENTEGDQCMVEGLVVEATDGDRRSMQLTDVHGHYHFDGLRPGTWTVTLHQGRLPPFHFVSEPTRRVEVASGSVAEVGYEVEVRRRTVRMVDAPGLRLSVGGGRDGSSRIEGTLFVDLDRDDLPGPDDLRVQANAVLLFEDGGAAAGSTSAKAGRFVFDGLAAGAYRLLVDEVVGGYVVASTENMVVVEADEIVDLPVPMIAQRTLGGIVWRTLGPGSYAPMAGVEVFLSDGRSTRTDGQGRYLFADLEPGFYEIYAEVTDAWAEAEVGVAAANLDAVDLVLPPGALAMLQRQRARAALLERGLALGDFELAIEPATITAAPADIIDLVATARFPGGEFFDVTQKVAWSVKNESVAQVFDGWLLAVYGGTTELYGELAGVVAPPVTVKVASEVLVGLDVRPRTASLRVGESFELKAVATLIDGSRGNWSRRVAWTSEDPQIAAVENGVVLGLAAGSTRVYAEVQGIRTFGVAVEVAP
jgi:hypothetical protein